MLTAAGSFNKHKKYIFMAIFLISINNLGDIAKSVRMNTYNSKTNGRGTVKFADNMSN